MLIKEYQDTTGFKDRGQMNKSEWVYDISGGGSYTAVAMSSVSVSNEQFLHNLSLRLSEKIKHTSTIPWPPHVDNLEKGEEEHVLLVQLLTWLK